MIQLIVLIVCQLPLDGARWEDGAPEELHVAIAGLVPNGDGRFCSAAECNALNGVYTLERNPPIDPNEPNKPRPGLEWLYHAPQSPPACTIEMIRFNAYVGSERHTHVRVEVLVHFGVGAGALHFRRFIPKEEFSIAGLNETVIPFWGNWLTPNTGCVTNSVSVSAGN